jgi:integrase
MAAKVVKLSGGTKYAVRFRGPDGQLRTFRVSNYLQAASAIADKVDQLLGLAAAKRPPMGELAEWANGVKPQWRAKLAAWGLLDSVDELADKPIGEHLDAWAAALAAKGVSAKRVAVAKLRAGGLLKRAGCQRLADASVANLNKALRELATGKLSTTKAGDVELDTERGPCSSNTQRDYRQCIGQFLRWAVAEGRIHAFAVERLAATRGRTELERRALTLSEQERLLTAAQCGADQTWVDRSGRVTDRLSGPERALAYRVALQTGLRASELASLRRSSFDVGANPTCTIKAGSAKNRRAFVFRLRRDTAALLSEHLRGKAPGTAAFALPPVHRFAGMVRADLAAARKAWLDEVRHDPDELATRQESDFLRDESHDGARFDFHSLRVSFVTNLAKAGVSVQLAAKMARHSDANLTLRVYTKVTDGEAERACNMLPDYGGVPETLAATGTDDATGEIALRIALQNRGAKGPHVSASVNRDSGGEDQKVQKTPGNSSKFPQLATTDESHLGDSNPGPVLYESTALTD